MSIDPEVLLDVIGTLPSGLQDKSKEQTLRAYLSNPVYSLDSLNSQTIVLSQLFSKLLSNSANADCCDLFLYATLNCHADIWFGLLISNLQRANVSSGELQQCINLLLKFLLDYGRFPQLLSAIHNISLCIPAPNRYSFIVDKLRQIVNVPTIVNNSIKSASLPKLFRSEVYFPFILRHSTEVNLSQMNPILISQACLQGFGNDAWNCILQQISRSMETSIIWSSALSQIQERALEPTIVPLLKKASHPHLVTICLSSALKSPLRSSLLRLFNRLLFFRHFPPCVPVCIFGFLKEVITDDLYIRVEKDLGLNLLNCWSDSTALNSSSSHNRIYLNQALVAWVCAFREYIVKSPNYHTMLSCVLKGISAHLSCNIEEQRVLGMSVGEWLMEKLEIGKKEDGDSEKNWLKFEYIENEAVKQVKPLFQPIPPYISSESQQNYDLDEIFSYPPDDSLTNGPSNVPSIVSELDSDDDPDEEEIELAQKFPKLPEYSKPAPTGWPFRERRPHYLRECMDGLSGVQHESDDVSSNEVALSCFAHAKELIYRHRGGAVDEIATSFADILLHTEPPACPDTDKVNESRNEALVALAVTSPRRTVRYLTGQLTQSSLGINQHHIIIAVLTSAAVELKENFIPVVGDFFFPMLRAADHWASRKPDDVYSHLDDGILARLVASLGSMYALASNSPLLPRMVKGLLDLSEALLAPKRDPAVRRALLTTLNVMLTATDSSVFAANYQLFLSSNFTSRLLRTLQVETDSDCQKLAQFALAFLRRNTVEFIGADLGGIAITD